MVTLSVRKPDLSLAQKGNKLIKSLEKNVNVPTPSFLSSAKSPEKNVNVAIPSVLSSTSLILRWIGILILLGVLVYSIVLAFSKTTKCQNYTLTDGDLDNIEKYLTETGFYNNNEKVNVNAFNGVDSIEWRGLRFYDFSGDNLAFKFDLSLSGIEKSGNVTLKNWTDNCPEPQAEFLIQLLPDS